MFEILSLKYQTPAVLDSLYPQTIEYPLNLELPDVASFSQDGPNNEAFGWGHYVLYSEAALLSVCSQAGYKKLKIANQVEPSGKFTLYGFFKK